MPHQDLACRLYIEAGWSLDELIGKIVAHVDGERSRATVTTTNFEVDIERSDDADRQKLSQDDGFLFYRFGAYVEPVSDGPRRAYVESLSQLILKLRNDGALVVASCEFEDEIGRLTGWNWSAQDPQH